MRVVACSICGKTTPTMEHVFYEGLCYESWLAAYPGKPWKPKRTWKYEATLYHFLEGQSGQGSLRNFCSPTCTTMGKAADMYISATATVLPSECSRKI